MQAMEKISEWGVRVNPLNRFARSLNEMLETYDEMQDKRAGLAYEIDGMVYKVNSLELRVRDLALLPARRVGRLPINSLPRKNAPA